jgi:hypothetical protein
VWEGRCKSRRRFLVLNMTTLAVFNALPRRRGLGWSVPEEGAVGVGELEGKSASSHGMASSDQNSVELEIWEHYAVYM